MSEETKMAMVHGRNAFTDELLELLRRHGNVISEESFRLTLDAPHQGVAKLTIEQFVVTPDTKKGET